MTRRGDGPWPMRGATAGLGKLYTVAEATEFLRLSDSTIRRAIRLKRLAAIKVGRAVRLAEADIDAWLNRNRRKPR